MYVANARACLYQEQTVMLLELALLLMQWHTDEGMCSTNAKAQG